MCHLYLFLIKTIKTSTRFVFITSSKSSSKTGPYCLQVNRPSLPIIKFKRTSRKINHLFLLTNNNIRSDQRCGHDDQATEMKNDLFNIGWIIEVSTLILPCGNWKSSLTLLSYSILMKWNIKSIEKFLKWTEDCCVAGIYEALEA